MPVYQLGPSLAFPNPELAEADGLLAVDGDLSSERLLLAYECGIFPWFSEGEPVLWWSPPQRMVLYPGGFKCSKSLQRTISKHTYEVTMDKEFLGVIEACSETPRSKQDGTWITSSIIDAYHRLHELGFAHSVEAWQHGKLVGGLYGVSLGRAFFGESMFSVARDASKVAFYHLHAFAGRAGFHFIDCQMHTQHLESLGAIQVPRARYLQELKVALAYPDLKYIWQL